MQNVITLGKKHVPLEQIVFVEPFDPESNPEFKPQKDFKARLVLLNRDRILTEETPAAFAEANGFRILAEDNVATNPAIAFRVESFEPTESFKPAKPYLTRLKWRDQEGRKQSKLLLTKPETVIAQVVRGDTPGADRKEPARRPTRTRSTRRDYSKLRAVTA
jgi:hypothetical protein